MVIHEISIKNIYENIKIEIHIIFVMFPFCLELRNSTY